MKGTFNMKIMYVINGIVLAALVLVILMNVIESMNITIDYLSVNDTYQFDTPLTVKTDTASHFNNSYGGDVHGDGVYHKNRQKFVSDTKYMELEPFEWLKGRYVIYNGTPIDVEDKIDFLVYNKTGNLLLKKQYDVPKDGKKRIFTFQYIYPLLIHTYIWDSEQEIASETEVMDINGNAPDDKAQFVLDYSETIWWVVEILSVIIGFILAFPITKWESRQLMRKL